MTRPAIFIDNLTALQRSLSLVLGEKRQIQRTFGPAGSATASIDVGDIATMDELSRLQAQIGSNFRVRLVPGANDLAGQNVGMYNLNDGTGGFFSLTLDFAAGGASGTPDDVTVSLAGLPFAYTLLDVTLGITTVIGASTATLRSAAAGAGTAYTNAMSTATAGLVRSTGTTLGMVDLPANSPLFLRRSDRAVVGTILITGLRTSA